MSKLWPKYENWSKLGKQNRVYRYTTVHVPVHFCLWWGVPVHYCSCTGTPSEIFPECVFSPPFFFHIFDTQFNSILHIQLKTISYSFYNLFSIQFLFQYLSLLQKSTMNYYLITLIWVMTHTQTKYKDLLGFVLTQLFYLAINQ